MLVCLDGAKHHEAEIGCLSANVAIPTDGNLFVTVVRLQNKRRGSIKRACAQVAKKGSARHSNESFRRRDGCF